jgi:hypothetical protein
MTIAFPSSPTKAEFTIASIALNSKAKIFFEFLFFSLIYKYHNIWLSLIKLKAPVRIYYNKKTRGGRVMDIFKNVAFYQHM